jgi:hypothetical protein
LDVEPRLIYDFSSLPVVCHAGDLREVFSYAARVVLHGVSNFEASLGWRDDRLVLGARIDGRDEVASDAPGFLTDALVCERFGLVFASGRVECTCTKLVVQLGARGRLIETWTEDS